MNFITNQGLTELKNYQYKSGGYSWLDNKLNVFWVKCVELLPLWLAPNLITFIGFLFMISSCAINLFYDATLTKEVPSWIFFYSAFCIFIYQTLDAIDGKQARRTKSSSPLGQLFDHGCDSFVMTFFILNCASAVQLEKHYLFYLFLGAQIILWGVNQKEHHTGVLHTHINNFGVTEVEFLCMSVVLISGIFGQQIWSLTARNVLPSSLLQNTQTMIIFDKPIVIIVLYPVLFLQALASIYMLFSNIIEAKHKARAALEWVPLVLIWILEFVWFQKPVYEDYAGVILLHFGILISLVVCKTIICSTTKDTPPLIHFELLPFILATLYVYKQNELTERNVKIVFQLSFLFTVYTSLAFLQGVVMQITKFLGIYCFSIEKRNAHHKNL